VRKYLEFVKADKLSFPKPNENPNENHAKVFAWWKRNSEHFPELTNLARRFLAISISSVASERCFSKASILYRNTLRTRLSKEISADLIQIQTSLAEKIIKKAKNQENDDSSDDDDFID
jgi:hypothetical protein